MMAERCEVCNSATGQAHAHAVCQRLDVLERGLAEFRSFTADSMAALKTERPELHREKSKALGDFLRESERLLGVADGLSFPVPATLERLRQIRGAFVAKRMELFPADASDIRRYFRLDSDRPSP